MQAEPSDIPNKAQFPKQTILFDLDGTLIDHFSAIHRAVVFAQRQLGLAESSYGKVRASVGGSVPITLGKLCGSAEQAAAAEPHFRRHFAEIMLEDVAPLPGAEAILKALKNAGCKIAVVTNKYDGHAKSTLAHLGLDRWLDAIYGTADGQRYRKPDPRFTMQALDALESSSDDCLYIGDSPYDFATAEAACMPCHLVTTGSHSAAELEAQTKADGIHADLNVLGRAVFGLELKQMETQS